MTLFSPSLDELIGWFSSAPQSIWDKEVAAALRELSNLRTERDVLQDKIEQLTAEVTRYKAALELYADEQSWQSPSTGFALQYDPEPSKVQKAGRFYPAQRVLAGLDLVSGRECKFAKLCSDEPGGYSFEEHARDCPICADGIEELEQQQDTVKTVAVYELAQRIEALEVTLLKIANSGIGGHSSWGWIALCAHNALAAKDDDDMASYVKGE